MHWFCSTVLSFTYITPHIELIFTSVFSPLHHCCFPLPCVCPRVCPCSPQLVPDPLSLDFKYLFRCRFFPSELLFSNCTIVQCGFHQTRELYFCRCNPQKTISGLLLFAFQNLCCSAALPFGTTCVTVPLSNVKYLRTTNPHLRMP